MSHHPSRLSRRRFLAKAVQAAGAAAIPLFIVGKALGKDGAVLPSEKVIVGGIGIGNRGSYDLGCFLEQPDVRVAAICDVKSKRREEAKRTVNAKYGDSKCVTYRDLREMLARKDIDAVLIATGPNWHAAASMLAANAGKDVYCEKPCTKNIAESLVLAETFRRTGQIFQAGTQRRNLPHIQFAVELRGAGELGKLRTVYAHPAGMAAVQSGWARAKQSRPKTRSIGISTSGRRRGGLSVPGVSTGSTSRKAAGWSAAACSNGARIASTCASGRPTPTAPPRSNTIRRKAAGWSPAMPAE